MNWKARLTGIVLAGGAVAGCSSSDAVSPMQDAGPDTSIQIPICNANPDPCCAKPDSLTCKNGHTVDSGVVVGPEGGACNANPDPCCGYVDAAACPYKDAGSDAASDAHSDAPSDAAHDGSTD